jgi:hypothetical protein
MKDQKKGSLRMKMKRTEIVMWNYRKSHHWYEKTQ